MEENNEMIPVPQSLDEAFRVLDEIVADEDKQAILNGADTHFGLGLWIRNEWIHPREREEFEPLVNEIEDILYKGEGVQDIPGTGFRLSFLAGNPDMISSSLIDLYIQHLNGTFKK